MELPRALAQWAPYLDIFPPAVGLGLAPLVRRVALAIGPLANRAGRDGSEPDGFDGLTRRGSYERLMLSELAVADEYPDEFIRRAAMGEHLFYRLALQSPMRSRTSAALFDAGPNQLGSPRVAHIAVLVALARRAEAAGARFGWSVLQRPDLPIFTDVTPESVTRLLALKTSGEATDDQLSVWRERVGEWAEPDDLWLVGGARLGRLGPARGLSRIEIVDPCDPASSRIELTVRTVASAPRAVALDLPDDASCARLLRDPFGTAVGETVRVAGPYAPKSKLLFDASGVKLFARNERGQIVAYPVPNSPRAGVGWPKLPGPYPTGKVFAAGRAFRKMVIASTDGVMIVLDTSRRPAPLPTPGHYRPLGVPLSAFRVDDDGLGLVHVVSTSTPSEKAAIVHHPAGLLLRLSPGPSHEIVEGRFVAGTATVVATDVLAATTRHSRLVFVGRERPGDPIRLVSMGDTIERQEVVSSGDPPSAAFFGFGGGLARSVYGLVAIGEGRYWRVLSNRVDVTIVVRPPRNVVGVVAHQGRTAVPRLLVVEEDRRTISFQSEDLRQTLVTARAPVVSVAVSPTSPTFAFSTETGEVVFYSLAFGAELCRFSTGETR